MTVGSSKQEDSRPLNTSSSRRESAAAWDSEDSEWARACGQTGIRVEREVDIVGIWFHRPVKKVKS